jgi:hypothetical protein
MVFSVLDEFTASVIRVGDSTFLQNTDAHLPEYDGYVTFQNTVSLTEMYILKY